MARETVEDWKAIGDKEPWYGVLSAPQFLSANITELAKEAFYSQGVDEIKWVVERIKSFDQNFSPSRALDFGSGLGRLSFAMSNYCPSIFGVDVSPGMIAEAEKQKLLRGHGSVQFGAAIPEGEKFDWINSYIVFQHIAPRAGYAIIDKLLSSLLVGGWTSIHLTFAHDHRDCAAFTRDNYAYRYDGETATTLETKDAPVGEMSMYDYDLNKILFMYIRAGIRNINLVHTDHGGVHGFWIFGRL